MRRRPSFALLIVAAAFALAPAASDAAISQPKGRAGCVDASGCTKAHDAGQIGSVIVSPDGRNVYTAAFGDEAGIAAFARNARTGVLRQLRGRAGCVTEDRTRTCARLRGMRSASALAMSADGTSLYVTSEHGLAVIARDIQTGALRQPAGTAGCVGAAKQGCAAALGLRNPSDVVVSADGTSVYAASRGNVVAFARDAATGALTQLPGATGCVGTDAGCTPARGVDRWQQRWSSLAIAPDGATLYLAGSTGTANALLTLRRDPASGTLTQLDGAAGCMVRNDAGQGCALAPQGWGGGGLQQIGGLVVAPDGQEVILAAGLGDKEEGDTYGSLAVFTRSAADGTLAPATPTYPSAKLSVRLGSNLAISSDGRTLLFGSDWDYVLNSFRRDPVTGAVSRSGCAAADGSPECVAVMFDNAPVAVAISPDGHSAYVATGGLTVLTLRP